MRSIRFLLWLPALLAAGCGGGNSEDPAPVRLPAVQDLSPAALAAAYSARVDALEWVSGGTLTLTATLPENLRLRVVESADGENAHLLLAAGPDSRLLHLSGLPDSPVLQSELSLPGAQDLAATGDSLYVLSASTLHEFSLEHVRERSLALPAGSARSFALSGPYAYIAAGADGLWTVDLSRNEPQPVSVNTATAISVEDITVAGNFAYVAEGAGGLGLLDISEGNAVVNLGNLDLLDCLPDSTIQAVEVLVREGLHYIYMEQAEGRLRMAALDSAVPGQLSLTVPVSGLATSLSCRAPPFALDGMQLADDGAQAWLGGRCCEGLYALISLSDDPLMPQLQVLLPPGVRSPGAPGRLYTTGAGRNTLQAQSYVIVETTRTAAAAVLPVFGDGLHLAGGDAWVVHPGGVVRAAVAGTPTQKIAEYLSVGRLSAIALHAGVAASSPLLYAGFDSGARIELWRMDAAGYTTVSSSAVFVSHSTATLPGVGALLFAQQSLFIADTTGHIQVMRDAGPETLRDFALTERCDLEGAGRPCIRLPGPVQALAYQSPHLYAGTADGSVHVLELQADALVSLATVRGSQPAASAAGVAKITLAGDFAYVSAHGAGVYVLNISTPARIRREAILRTQPGAFDAAVRDTLLYVATGYSVEVYDLSRPAVPVHLPALRVPGFAFALAVSAEALHILERYGWRDYYRILRPPPQP